MSIPRYEKTKVKKRLKTRFQRQLDNPLLKLRNCRPANVDFILNRYDYRDYR